MQYSMIEEFVGTGKSMYLSGIGLNPGMLPVFWGIMVAATFSWLFLSRNLYGVLQQKYPGIYNSLGRPKLVMRKSIAANYRVAAFLFRREYENTEDADVIRLCQGLRYVAFIFLFCLAGILVLLTGSMF